MTFLVFVKFLKDPDMSSEDTDLFKYEVHLFIQFVCIYLHLISIF